ncbi:PAS domain S-box protein [Limnoglobus roseus]|uniref:histidine kinase n=1 Tax=Limnoglobus roseus TaxID=2598579 RepID=A0A5C1AHQ2_9BACT|nr:PAS domain S-box protein [Limnoglobus roseus]QEL17793.1 PAS domain S-box protein [Limnoglobus roseus]
MTDRDQKAPGAQEGELFRLLVENVRDYAIFVIDTEGRVESWNPGAERLLGYGEEEILGRPAATFFTPEDIERGYPQREMREALEGGRGDDDRWQVRKDGSRFWCGGSLTPLWDEGHKLRGYAKIMRDRTEWKRAEEERAGRTREAERKQRLYDAVLSNTPDLVYVFDLDHRFTYANGGLLRLWGKTWDEAVGKTCLELGYEPWHAAMHDREIEQVVATKHPVKGEVPFTGTFGPRIYEYIFVPVLGEGGEVEAVAGTTRDVTDRRRSEEALREASATLRSFYDTAPVMMGVVEVVGEDVLHLTDNAATGRFFGTAPASLSGRAASEMGVPPDHLREWVRAYRESERTGQPARFEYPHETPTGRRWVSAIVYCIEALPGNRVRCSYVAEDVTERKRDEETIRSLLHIGEKLNSTLAVDELLDLLVVEAARLVGAESGVAGLNGPEGMRCHTYFQRGQCLPLDYCWPPMHGLPGWLLVHKVPYLTNDAVADTQIVHELCVRFGVRSALSTPVLSADGEVLGFFEIHNKDGGFTPADQEKLLSVSHAASIAVQNALAFRRIQRVEESLRDANRRKDEFLATLAHELRNPLAPISNALQILKMPRVEAATVERSRGMMERQVHHLVRLVDDLLDVSRVMRGKIELRRERVELATVVARAVETVQPLVDAQRHELDVRLPPESLPLDADPVRLTQVVGNLLTNAAKYTEPGGRIRLTAERDGDVAVLRVRDDGIGIAPDVLPHVFELFVQAEHATTKTQGGLGIGLTLVKNIVGMHNGTVEARSDGLGRGSEFAVRLPLVVGAGQQSQDNGTGELHQQPSRPSGHRLLVVDDNRDAADSLAMLLELQGHEVRVAHSGPAALEMTKGYAPDVVFLDIGMPGMDGYEVARRLRQQPGLESVVLAALTGWGQQEDRRRTAEAGFTHHLVKPPDPKAVEGVLAQLTPPDVK